MSEFKIPEKYKKFIDGKMIVILGIVAKMAWDTFTTGAEVKYQEHFRETLKTEGAKNIITDQINSEMDNALEDKNIWSKIFSNQAMIHKINSEVSKAKQIIVKEVLKADSTKIDFIGALGEGAGIRDEEIMPMFIKLMKAIDDGDLIFREDVEDLVKAEVRKRSRTVRGDF